MGKHLKIVTDLHQSTPLSYLERMNDDKVRCMARAREYSFDYWDGERRFGYGGYRYIPGRWQPAAEKLIEEYRLTNDSSVLDVGCGKAFLLAELKLLLPKLRVAGFDISSYGISHVKNEIRSEVFLHRADDRYPYKDDTFDLVISLGCLHNLRLPSLNSAIREIERVGKNSYIMVESYRSNQELFNLQCWALTAESFLDPEEWIWFFYRAGYSGDYEFIFFE
jgi:SAM-dependent methyltransferase